MHRRDRTHTSGTETIYRVNFKEILESKNFALIILRLYFTEVIMNTIKVILEN